MTDVLSSVQVVLQSAGYQTWDIPASKTPAVGFEDEAAMGFVCVFESPATLVKTWREAEAALLARFAAQFRLAGEKAWNVYFVLLTEARATDEQRREVRWIEEDLERTRKLTATGVMTREDVTTALLPLLPILSKPLLAPEDSAERLARRIAVIAPRVSNWALDASVSPAEVAARLRSDR
ncbi:MAG: hypothetical protein ABL879_01465 [Devosia sp.]